MNNNGYLPGMVGFTDNTTVRPSKLYYVTNATNMRSILATGQIRSSSGWPKYAADYQTLTTGYIPFYLGGIPSGSIEGIVTQHDKNDFAVVIEFDATNWTASNVCAIDATGKVSETELKMLSKQTVCILLRGLIPLADAKLLHFNDEKSAQRFISDCESFANARADLIEIGDEIPMLHRIVFNSPDKQYFNDKQNADSAEVIRRADSRGGVLSALTRSTGQNISELLDKLVPEWTAGKDSAQLSPIKYPDELYFALENWLINSSFDPADPAGMLLTAMLDYLSGMQCTSGVSAEEFLVYLGNLGDKLPEDHRDKYTERLHAIRDTVLHDANPSALFKQKRSPLFRGLLLYLLDPEYREHRALPIGCDADDNDLLTADILRGATRGWSRVPLTMRGPKQAELAIAYATARLTNNKPDRLKLPPLRFEWESPDLLMISCLRELQRILQSQANHSELKRLLITQKASEMEIKIQCKIAKSTSSKVVVERLLKPGKKKNKLTLTMCVPLK